MPPFYRGHTWLERHIIVALGRGAKVVFLSSEQRRLLGRAVLRSGVGLADWVGSIDRSRGVSFFYPRGYFAGVHNTTGRLLFPYGKVHFRPVRQYAIAVKVRGLVGGSVCFKEGNVSGFRYIRGVHFFGD